MHVSVTNPTFILLMVVFNCIVGLPVLVISSSLCRLLLSNLFHSVLLQNNKSTFAYMFNSARGKCTSFFQYISHHQHILFIYFHSVLILFSCIFVNISFFFFFLLPVFISPSFFLLFFLLPMIILIRPLLVFLLMLTLPPSSCSGLQNENVLMNEWIDEFNNGMMCKLIHE